MGNCCVKKPDSNKVPKYHNREQYQIAQQKAQQKQDHVHAQYLQQQENLAQQNNHNEQKQYIDSNKIMKNDAYGRVIGGNEIQDDQQIGEDERRRKMAEAAEQRQNKNKNRGLSQQGAIEMQFKERQQQEAEKYEKRYQEYNLKWRND